MKREKKLGKEKLPFLNVKGKIKLDSLKLPEGIPIKERRYISTIFQRI